jgi:hypothetical protein
MSPVSINGVDKQGVDKNGVQVKQTLSDANETVNKGVYAATTLSAVDADLAAANIKSGVTIFGKLGTLAASLAEDILNGAATTFTAAFVDTDPGYSVPLQVNANSDLDLATCTTNFNATSRAVGSGFALGRMDTGSYNKIKLRLYMNGTQVAESGYWADATAQVELKTVKGTAALSGSKIVKIALHCYGSLDILYSISNYAGGVLPIGVMVGSIKLV